MNGFRNYYESINRFPFVSTTHSPKIDSLSLRSAPAITPHTTLSEYLCRTAGCQPADEPLPDGSGSPLTPSIGRTTRVSEWPIHCTAGHHQHLARPQAAGLHLVFRIAVGFSRRFTCINVIWASAQQIIWAKARISSATKNPALNSGAILPDPSDRCHLCRMEAHMDGRSGRCGRSFGRLDDNIFCRMTGGAERISRLETRACCHSALRNVHYPAILCDPDARTASGDENFLPAAECRRTVFPRSGARFSHFRATFLRAPR